MADDHTRIAPELDADYLAWRAQQLALYDRDYAAWRQSQADFHDQGYRAWRASAGSDRVSPWTRVSPGSPASLPAHAARVAEDFPELWAAFQELGEAATRAGPLESLCRRLVHLAMALATGSEGSVHSHVRQAVAEGIPVADLEHVALLAVTALGWSQAMKGLCWIRDVTRP